MKAATEHDCDHPHLHEGSDAADYIGDENAGRERLSAPGRIDPIEASRITRRITAYAVLVGIVLTVLKLFVWQDSHSVGILSSLVHSGLDLIGALATFFGVRYAARAPDATHSFGRGKAEGFIAVLQACLVAFAALHISEEAIERLLHPEEIEQGLAAIAVMAFAVALTFWLLMAQTHAISATGSVAIKGDRAHFMSDMMANAAVLVGVALAAFTPFIWADALIALGIAIWLLITAVHVGRMAFNQLMDKELPDNEREFITALVMKDTKILSVKELRTRASGPHVHMQMHAEMAAGIALSEAHEIITAAEQRVLTAFPAADVTIHPDPEGCAHHGNSRFRRA